ncbi:MAG: ABC transporter ATP-binding protein [Candidatus Methanoperedens sp.]|nr:ABC transporter ATP-binding protein [Candidatus Methanoperedens sp.]
MSSIVLEMDHVYKKFKKGERYDSLRDLIPGLVGRFFDNGRKNPLLKHEFWALSDVTFEVKKGEAFGIIGPNGSGKSTTLKLLSGIMKPTKGAVKIDGRLSALIEVGAGFHKDLTGRENIFLNGTILGMRKEEIRRRFDEIVEFSGLEEFIDTPVKRYSSGMYARLGFSVAAHVDPDILVVDEVLSVGDYLFQKRCVERMNSVIKSGATVIFVSHNLNAVSALCGRALLLENGKIKKVGATNEVIKYYMSGDSVKDKTVLEKEAFISKVNIRDETGDCFRFESGQKVWIDIEVTARTQCKKLTIEIYIEDDNFYNIFDTSTERLNRKTFSLNAEERWKCTSELCLHLVSGTYHLGIKLNQYDTQEEYDRWFPAGTIYVGSDEDVRGVANLNPRIMMSSIDSE